MRKIIVSVKMQKTTMKNDTLEMELERTFEFPRSEYSIGNKSNYIKIYELGTGRTVLFVPFTSLNYISVEEVEEEENDPEIQE